jgi:hypothetical protein
VRDLVERCCDDARAIVEGLVRFLDRRPGAKPEDRDRRTGEVLARTIASVASVLRRLPRATTESAARTH